MEIFKRVKVQLLYIVLLPFKMTPTALFPFSWISSLPFHIRCFPVLDLYCSNKRRVHTKFSKMLASVQSSGLEKQSERIFESELFQGGKVPQWAGLDLKWEASWV